MGSTDPFLKGLGRGVFFHVVDFATTCAYTFTMFADANNPGGGIRDPFMPTPRKLADELY